MSSIVNGYTIEPGADLSDADLSDATLTGAFLEEADLTGADLTGANLSGADLSFANLSYANLIGADLSFANLWGADLRANLGGADLRGAGLSDADLSHAELTGAILTGAILTGADLFSANLTYADLTNANLWGAALDNANLDGADLTGAILYGAYLSDADLTGAILDGANLSGANLSDADLSYADLGDTDLTDARLTGADLTGAILDGANLSGANLSDADLSYADLRTADLAGADLTDADLTGANVNGATGLEVLSQEQLDVTIVNNLPSGAITIDGTAQEGETLTVVTSALSDADGLAAFSYQWLRGDADITGATSETYTLAQADVGAAISARVSYTDNGGTAESVTSSATSSIINVNDAPTGSITISGTASEGQVLTVDTSSLADEDGLGALSYQWFANDEALFETSSIDLFQRKNILQRKDEDELFSYKLIGSDNPDDGLGVYAFELTFYDRVDDSLVKLSDDFFEVTPPEDQAFETAGTFDKIMPETNTFTVTESEVGKAITVKVSYTDDGGTSESVMSAMTCATSSVRRNCLPIALKPAKTSRLHDWHQNLFDRFHGPSTCVRRHWPTGAPRSLPLSSNG
ncbi:pentapeptide repeat-containing protein [Planktomarina temperata]|nr:pentapeptide repeat-containing protein [Planktomarina temperata]